MTRDQELWATALRVEKQHAECGPQFIAEQIERNKLTGEQGGVDLWEAVRRRFEALHQSASTQ